MLLPSNESTAPSTSSLKIGWSRSRWGTQVAGANTTPKIPQRPGEAPKRYSSCVISPSPHRRCR
uniref:Uncharacterized protein n=1 Tax=Arundo donax TaxID=35708 RepID=A0A0A9JT48_ARUDO